MRLVGKKDAVMYILDVGGPLIYSLFTWKRQNSYIKWSTCKVKTNNNRAVSESRVRILSCHRALGNTKMYNQQFPYPEDTIDL